MRKLVSLVGVIAASLILCVAALLWLTVKYLLLVSCRLSH